MFIFLPQLISGTVLCLGCTAENAACAESARLLKQEDKARAFEASRRHTKKKKKKKEGANCGDRLAAVVTNPPCALDKPRQGLVNKMPTGQVQIKG